MPKFFNKKTATVRFHGFNEEKKYQNSNKMRRTVRQTAGNWRNRGRIDMGSYLFHQCSLSDNKQI